MATAVPSRFAVLAIDVDDCKPKKNHKSSTIVKPQSKNKNDKVKHQQTHQQQSKKDEKKKLNKNKKKKNNNENQQWEQWKEKDSAAVEEAYQHELNEAMLLSKLSYESRFDSGVDIKNEDHSTKNTVDSKKSEKVSILQEGFNNRIEPNNVSERPIINPCESFEEPALRDGNSKVLEQWDEEAEKETRRIQMFDECITFIHLNAEIQKRDDEIQELKDEVSTLKEELSHVKQRNKKLYQILSHGEMKDKASVLAEVAKLQEIRDELTSEVSSLHAQLEQERSKTRTSITDTGKSTKQANKKRPASKNA